LGRASRGGRSHTVVAAVEELLDNYLLGEDPARIEDHWQAMYRGGFYRGGPVLMSAIAGVDQNCGTSRESSSALPSTNFSAAVRATESACTSGSAETDQQMSATPLVKKVDAGFTALKMNATAEMRPIDTPATVADAVDRIAAVRESVGDEVDIRYFPNESRGCCLNATK